VYIFFVLHTYELCEFVSFHFPTVIYNIRKRITHTLWNLLCLSLTAACQSTAWLGIIFFENVNLITTLKTAG